MINFLKSKTRLKIEVKIKDLEERIAELDIQMKEARTNPKLYVSYFMIQKDWQKQLTYLKELL